MRYNSIWAVTILCWMCSIQSTNVSKIHWNQAMLLLYVVEMSHNGDFHTKTVSLKSHCSIWLQPLTYKMALNKTSQHASALQYLQYRDTDNKYLYGLLTTHMKCSEFLEITSKKYSSQIKMSKARGRLHILQFTPELRIDIAVSWTATQYGKTPVLEFLTIS